MTTPTATLSQFAWALGLALVTVGYICFSVWRLKNKPAVKPHWPQRVLETILFVGLIAIYAPSIHSMPVIAMSLAEILVRPSLWPAVPVELVFCLVMIPSLLWALALSLKGRSGLALAGVLYFLLVWGINGNQINNASRWTDDWRYEMNGQVLVTPVFSNGTEATGLHVVINGIDFGPGPVLIDEEKSRLIQAASGQTPPGMTMKQAAQIQLPVDASESYPYPVNERLEQPKRVNFPAHVWMLADGRPRLPLSLEYSSSSETVAGADRKLAYKIKVAIKTSQLVSEVLPMLSWSRLHPTPEGELPGWWKNPGFDPKKFGDTLADLSAFDPEYSRLSLLAAEALFNDGKKIDPGNALSVLNRIDANASGRLHRMSSIETLAARSALVQISPADLAQWYIPKAQSWFDLQRWPDVLLLNWVDLHRLDTAKLAEAGELLGPTLLANSRYVLAVMLGGESLNKMGERLIDELLETEHYQVMSKSLIPSGWVPNARRGSGEMPYYHTPLFQVFTTALPGPVGDKARALFANGAGYPYDEFPLTRLYAETMQTRAFSDGLYDELIRLAVFEPVAPSPREYLELVWSKISPLPWSRHGRMPVAEYSPAGRLWRFLSGSLRETSPEKYIAVAQQSIRAMFEQSPEDFVEQVGRLFDQNVDLPIEVRDRVWAALVESIIKKPKAYGLTVPPDQSRIQMNRPAFSEDRVSAAIVVSLPDLSSDELVLRDYRYFEFPPGYPQILAKRVNPNDRIAAVLTAIRCPSPENLTTLKALTHDPDASVAAHAKAGERFVAYLRALPADKLPAPFTREAMDFFDLGRFMGKGE